MNYHARVVRLTQNKSPDRKEDTVNPEEIYTGNFLHVYVVASIPPKSQLRISIAELPDGGASVDKVAASPTEKYRANFKFVIDHYRLKPRKRYKLRVFDRLPNSTSKKLSCLASQDVKILPRA